MNIFTKAIVSNSDMIKKYKACRDKAEELGKIFIMKNNQADAVLFSISEYEKISALVEYMESLADFEFEDIMKSLSKKGIQKKYTIEEPKKGEDYLVRGISAKNACE